MISKVGVKNTKFTWRWEARRKIRCGHLESGLIFDRYTVFERLYRLSRHVASKTLWKSSQSVSRSIPSRLKRKFQREDLRSRINAPRGPSPRESIRPRCTWKGGWVVSRNSLLFECVLDQRQACRRRRGLPPA